jgi:putative phosphoribosyl transferase
MRSCANLFLATLILIPLQFLQVLPIRAKRRITMTMTLENKYPDRHEAGNVLAAMLNAYRDRDDVLVLGLARGGVPVAYEIARALEVALDVFIVRKLGVPHQSELAMGAIALGDTKVFNETIISQLGISKKEINAVIIQEQKELARRELAYRGNRPFPDLKNITIILVDDGIATGATIRAAIQALRQMKVKKIIVAVPVADKAMCEMLAPLVDEFYCPLQPTHFNAVGMWYENFSQTEDEEVYFLLREAKKLS